MAAEDLLIKGVVHPHYRLRRHPRLAHQAM